MPTPILMPALSPTMETGTLAKWLKKEGDEVRSGDVIAEIETDKATMEVEAVDEGRLGRILVAEGTEDVAVNATIAMLLGEGEDESALEGAEGKAEPKKAGAEARPPTPGPSPQGGGGQAGGRAPPERKAEKEAEKAPSAPAPSPLVGEGRGGGAAVPRAQRWRAHLRLPAGPAHCARQEHRPCHAERLRAARAHRAEGRRGGQARRAPAEAPAAAAAARPWRMRRSASSSKTAPTTSCPRRHAQDRCQPPAPGHPDDSAFLPHHGLRHRHAAEGAPEAQRFRAARTPTASRPGSCRSTTSSSRRWRSA
jgi:pyruvate dehydrogenase E2 component (dihydrolipoamide acetyltransferase)